MFCEFFCSADTERDVFNEKPSKEEVVAATQVCAFFSVSFVLPVSPCLSLVDVKSNGMTHCVICDALR